jgi:hypothetical protein
MIVKQQTSKLGDAQFLDSDFYTGAKSIIRIIGDQATKYTPTALNAADVGLGFSSQVERVDMHTMGSTSSQITAGPVANRIERVQDPADAGKQCWRFQIHNTDPDTAGSSGQKRAEFRFNPNVNAGVPLTAGYWFRVPNYKAVTDQFMVIQWHSNDSLGWAPWWAMWFVAGVMRFRCFVRTGSSAYTENINIVMPDWLPDHWYKLVVSFKASTSDNLQGGYIKVWLEDLLILDFVGNIGFQENGEYLKSGIYLPGQNSPYDTSVPLRTVYGKGPYVMYGDHKDFMNDLLDDIN